MKREGDGDDGDEPDYEGMSWEEATRSANHPDFRKDLLELKRLRDEVGNLSDCVVLHQNLPDKLRPHRVELTIIRPEDAARAACGLAEVLDIPIATKDHKTQAASRPLSQEEIRGERIDGLFEVASPPREKPAADWFTDEEALSLMSIAGSLDLWRSADQQSFITRMQRIAKDKGLNINAAKRLALLYIRWVTES